MAFRFSLQPVLRLHASYERMERMRLLAISAAVVRLRQEISALEHENLKTRQSTQSKLAAGVVAGELHFELLAASIRLERKRVLKLQLADLEKKQEVQRKAYAAAQQKLDILQNLRDGQLSEYRIEESRREQKQADELFLLHRGSSGTTEPE